MVLNAQLLDLARPRIVALREALLGREDAFHRDMLDAQRGEYPASRRVEGQGEAGLFAGIGLRDKELRSRVG